MQETREGPVLVIGSAGVDLVGRAASPLQIKTSNPGELRLSNGGVARNIAENLARLGAEVLLVSAVGDDPQAVALLDQAAAAGVNVQHVRSVEGAATGAYLAVLDSDGSLHLGLDDMSVIGNLTPDYLSELDPLFGEASVVAVDANLPPESLGLVVDFAQRHKVPLAADPTSTSLAVRLMPHLEDLWLVTPNEPEAAVLSPHEVPHADVNRALTAAKHLVSAGVEIAVITMAEFGLGYAWAEGSGHVPAVRTEIVDPTGAGDALTAAVIFSLLNGIPVDEAVRLGLAAAAYTLRTAGSVASDLSLELLYDQLRGPASDASPSGVQRQPGFRIHKVAAVIPEWLQVHAELRRAIANSAPVVALESAVVTHGLPRPINLELARRMQAEVQRAGALPAMAGMIDGELILGLAPEQVEQLSLNDSAIKLSRRDLGPARAAGQSGGTTVAATLFIAQAAGVPVFATGGIGGVHRGASGDISADVLELARSRLVVVCSGAKAILDLPRTLEALETAGVAVVGYQTDHFPAFYARSSQLPLAHRAEDLDQLAAVAKAHLQLGVGSALLACVPCPDQEALAAEELEQLLVQAEQRAAEAGISGAELTPYLLAQVAELSGGRALAANLALLRNNARVAAELAAAIA